MFYLITIMIICTIVLRLLHCVYIAATELSEAAPNSRGTPAYDLAAPAHADVLLQVFTQAEDAETCKSAAASGRGPAPARSYQCRAGILSAWSEYFSIALSDTWQQQQGQQDQQQQQGGDDQTTQQATGSAGGALSPTRTVKVHMEKGELGAMHELLKMIHAQQQLPATSVSRSTWFRCMRLADRFQAISCLDLMVARLADMPAGKQMPADIAQLVLGRCAAAQPAMASPAAAASPLSRNLRQAGGRAMVRLYTDVPAVIYDAGLSAEFCSRPHAAVLAWAESDNLLVHRENCVVFLLSAWAKANPSSTAEQLEQLAQQVRVFHLGPAYQQHIVPELAWFKACSAMQHWPSVLSCVRAGISMKRGLDVEKAALRGRLLDLVAKLPAGLTSKPRKCIWGSKEWTWCMAPRDLNLFNGGAVYVDGFMVDMKAQCCDTARPPAGKCICVSVGVDRNAMHQRGVPLPPAALLRLGPVSFTVTSAASSCPDLAAGTFVHHHYVMASTDRIGCYEAFCSDPSFEGLVKPFLREKQLRARFTFSAIDGSG